jgi:hypothetical protein
MSRALNAVLVAALPTLTACASTGFLTTWKAPDARPLTFRGGAKVLALVVSPDESLRRDAEPALAAALRKHGLEAFPADTVVPSEAIRDEARARALVEASGAAGVVAMQVVGREEGKGGAPPAYTGPHYRTFWGGYYGWGWGVVSRPEYLRMATAVSVETLVYDLGRNELVWAGESKAMDPSRVGDSLVSLALKSVGELEKQGLIPSLVKQGKGSSLSPRAPREARRSRPRSDG